jgi:hypothetical protein
MSRTTATALAFRLMGVVGLCLFALGVLTDTLVLSIVGGALLLVAVVAGWLDVRRRTR